MSQSEREWLLREAAKNARRLDPRRHPETGRLLDNLPKGDRPVGVVEDDEFEMIVDDEQELPQPEEMPF